MVKMSMRIPIYVLCHLWSCVCAYAFYVCWVYLCACVSVVFLHMHLFPRMHNVSLFLLQIMCIPVYVSVCASSLTDRQTVSLTCAWRSHVASGVGGGQADAGGGAVSSRTTAWCGREGTETRASGARCHPESGQETPSSLLSEIGRDRGR
jgi:hypothetical protein